MRTASLSQPRAWMGGGFEGRAGRSLLGDDEHWAAVEGVVGGDGRGEVEADGAAIRYADEVSGVRNDVVVKVGERAKDCLQVTAEQGEKAEDRRLKVSPLLYSGTRVRTRQAYLSSQSVGVNHARGPFRLGHWSRT